MSKNGIKNERFHWTQEDVQYLIENFNNMSLNELTEYYNGRHTKKAISTKAIKLNLTQPQEWTQDELDTLKQYYSNVPIDDMLIKIPRRSKNAIILKAVQLGIKSYHYLNEKYTDDEVDFIINSFGKLTDEEIANVLRKSKHGIADQRRKYNLLYCDKEYAKYENISKLLRGQIWQWKSDSMSNCNYQCILTGSKDFDIHHLIGFNTILKEVFNILSNEGKLKDDNISSYTKNELNYIIDLFKECHEKYPLGVCIRKDIHALFHKIYGSGGNTIAQWDTFINDYNNHLFDDKYYAI